MVRSRLFWWRSARRRPATFVALALLSVGAVAVSVLTPLLLRAVDQSTLRTALGRAGMTVTADVQPQHVADSIAAAAQVAASARDPLLGRGSVSVESTIDIASWGAPGSSSPTAPMSLFAAPGSGCARIRITAGTCVDAEHEVLLPDAAARAAGLGPGATAVVAVQGRAPVRMHVVGTYDPDRSTGLVLTRPSSQIGSIEGITADDLVVTRDEIDALGLHGTVSVRRPLGAGVRLQDLAGLRAAVQQAQAATLEPSVAVHDAAVVTTLPARITAVEQQQAAAAVLLSLVAVDAVGLTWFAQALVVQRVGRARAREWGIGRLRGAPRLPRLTGIFLEPAIALLLGGAAGAVAGAVLAEVVVSTALRPVVPLELGQPAVLVAAGLTLLGSVVALVAASLRSARTPLPALLRETAEPRRLSRAGVAGQSGLVIVTLLTAYTAATNSRISGPQVALLVPGLLAALFGLAAVRAAVGGARLVSARPPRSLAGVLVGRRLARAPSELYTVIVIVVGVALAGYCMQLALVAARLEDARAAATVGSATVLRVTVPRDLPLQRAVERADPSGRSALAAEELSPASASGTGRVVALDTTRLRAVTGDVGVDLPPSLLAALRPRVGPSMVLRGTSLRIVLDDARITSFGDQTALVGLSMVVQDDAGWHTVSLGPVRSGAIEAPIPCPSGCRVVWIGTHGLMKAATPYQADMTITSISTDQQSAAALAPWLDPTRWRNRIGEQTNPERPARATVAAANGLFVDFADDQGSDFTTISTFDAPEPLPVIVGSDTGPQPYPGLPSTAFGTGLDELPRVLHVVGAVDVLPRLLHVGALADLEMMNRVDDPGASKAVDEVWLAPGPHPAVLASLRRQGVTVQHVEHADSVAGTYRREPVPLAAALTGAIALTVVLLVVLTLVATRVIDADARRREWRSALAAGVDERRLRRLLSLSVLVPDAVGVLLGAAAGTIAFLLTASRLPLLTGAGPVPTPDFAPPLLPVAAAALGVVVLIAAVAVLSARREVRRLDGR